MSTNLPPYRIAEKEPDQWPCWIWTKPVRKEGFWQRVHSQRLFDPNRFGGRACVCTHWWPDQPEGPTIIPDQPTAPRVEPAQPQATEGAPSLELLPCPFCASVRIIKGERYFAMCVDCGATGPERATPTTPERKWKCDWNNRSKSP
jgi:hypothetical protein